VSQGRQVSYQPLSVLGGTTIDVWITGSGDADLYVQFGSAPTRWSYDCRPYLNGSNESCSLDVPANQSQAYIMVRGYTSATYTVSAEWVSP
jgi:leucyl aminopeptidase